MTGSRCQSAWLPTSRGDDAALPSRRCVRPIPPRCEGVRFPHRRGRGDGRRPAVSLGSISTDYYTCLGWATSSRRSPSTVTPAPSTHRSSRQGRMQASAPCSTSSPALCGWTTTRGLSLPVRGRNPVRTWRRGVRRIQPRLQRMPGDVTSFAAMRWCRAAVTSWCGTRWRPGWSPTSPVSGGSTATTHGSCPPNRRCVARTPTLPRVSHPRAAAHPRLLGRPERWRRRLPRQPMA